MPLYHATITGKDYDAMADLVRKHRITVARHTATGSGPTILTIFPGPQAATFTQTR